MALGDNKKHITEELLVFEGPAAAAEKTIFELDMIVIILCDEGQFRLEIDGKETEVSKGDILICPPGLMLSNLHEEGKGILKLVGMKYSKIHKIQFSGRSVWSTMMYARNNPVFHLDEAELELTRSYFSVIKQKSSTAKDFYYNEIMASLLECAFYEICVIINRKISPSENDNIISRKDLIFKKFMELLATSDCRERSVAFFAERLCISPKYLASVIKDVSGRNAIEIILQNATDMIRRDLEHPDMSIKEIADKYNFQNISAFGKFIKNRLGKAPRFYREDNMT